MKQHKDKIIPVKLTKKFIREKFRFLDENRHVAEGSSVMKSLSKVTYIPDPIVVSLRKDGFYWVLDGQHRLTSVIMTEREVAGKLQIFSELTKPEELEVIQVFNTARKFDSHDKLKLYREDLVFTKEIMDVEQLTISHGKSHSKGEFSLGGICMALSRAKHQTIQGWDLIEHVKLWGKEDILLTSTILTDMLVQFGEPQSIKWAYSSTFFCTAFIIYWTNKDNFPMSEIGKRMGRIQHSTKLPEIVEMSKFSGSNGIIYLKKMLKSVLNLSSDSKKLVL